jgi:uncharacterized membrane protein
MNPEDQELRERVAKLEKELAEIRQLLSPKEVEDPWAARKGPDPESAVKTPDPVEVKEPLRTSPTPPPVVAQPQETPQGTVEVFKPIPRFPEPDKVRIKPEPSAAGSTTPPAPAAGPEFEGRNRSEDVEFKIGGRYLAFAGGIVVLLGMLYLVTLAISSRWITMEMQFGGELFFCALLAGLGLWKLNEKETVGQVLVGTGSCGAFLSFAGAHVFKGILSLDALIVACLCLSLLNFAFSEWRRSQIFFVFGMLGGFIASALPQPDRVALSQMLQAVVLAPAVLVVVRRKWMGMAYLLWPTAAAFGLNTLSGIEGSNFHLAKYLASITSAAPLSTGADFSWGYWAAFSIFGLAASAAYLLVHKDDPQEPGPVLAWIGPFFFTILPFALLPELAKPWGFAATLAVCLAHLALSRFAASQESQKAQMLGAAAAGLIVPAFSLTFAQASGVYAIEALALAGVWLAGRRETSVISLAVTVGMLGWFAGVPGFFESFRPVAALWDKVLGSVPSLIIAVAASVFIWKKGEDFKQNPRSFLFFGFAAALGMGLVKTLLTLEVSGSEAFSWAMLATLVSLALCAWLDKTKDSVPAQVIFTILALVGTAISGSQKIPLEQEAIQNFFILAAVLVFALVHVKIDPQKAANGAITASLAMAYPFARLVYIAATNLGADQRSALLIGFALFALLVSLVAKWQKWKDLSGAAGVYACAVIVPYSGAVTGQKLTNLPLIAGFESAGLVVVMATIVMVTLSFREQAQKEQDVATVFGIVAFSIPAGRIAWIVMSQPWLQLQLAQAMLLFFALYAAILALYGKAGKSAAVSWTASFYLAFGLVCYPVMKMPGYFELEMPMLIGGVMADAGTLASLLASSLLVARAILASSKDHISVLVTFCGLNWALFSGLLMILAQQPPLSMKFDFSMSAAWVIYGVILLVIGFIKDKSVYRISGLVVFSATLCKVFLYDLSYLETIIKVILFISFGVVMLAISYAYTWFSRTHRKPEGPS